MTWGMKSDVRVGDILLFYRIGETIPKKYSSVISTVGVIDGIVDDFKSKENFMSYCENRSVFSKEELEEFWNKHRYNLCVVKFIYIKSLTSKLTLGYLWDENIVQPPNGPRSFMKLQDEQFEKIIKDSNTNLYRGR